MTGISDYDPLSNAYIDLAEFDRDVIYRNREHALYTMFSSKIKDLGYQFGLRAEYTDREVELRNRNENFVIDRFDNSAWLVF